MLNMQIPKCCFIKNSLSLSFILFNSLISFAQISSINIINIDSNVLVNTKLLFGITFDGRTSLIGSSNYGQIGYYDTTGAILPPIDSIFSDFPLTTVRYPANGNAVGFEWKKSIGPLPRPVQDLLGTIGSPQPVNFGFDEFIEMCFEKGITGDDIQIMVPIYDDNTTGLTNTQMLAAVPDVISNNADWVEYCNSPNNGSNPGGGTDWAAVRAANGHPNPYNIKIWNIGNEPWAMGEFTAFNCANYLNTVTPIIDAMLAIDPTLKITMPTTGIGNGSWFSVLLNSTLAQQGKIYALSQHFFGDEQLSTPNPNIASCDTFLNNLITGAKTKGIKIIIGDYAHSIPSTNPTMAQQDLAMQWRGANFIADFLLMLSQKSDIERANFWTYGNVYATWHPIKININGDYKLMPAAEIYKILQPAFLDKSIKVSNYSPTSSDGILYSVRSNAFVTNDLSKLNIVAVNRDRNNTERLKVYGLNGYNLSKATLYNAQELTSDSIIKFETSADVYDEYVMPASSILILEFIVNSENIEKLIIQDKSIKCYPNPTNGNLIFSETLENIEMFDFSGRQIISKKGTSNFISIENMQPGVYFIKSGKTVLKFVID